MTRSTACALVLFIAIPAFSEPIVSLKVKERGGAGRSAEVVTMGVPLPESLYTDTGDFALKDASGNVVPCEFRKAQKWWRDKTSIRWLHLDFQTDIAANETRTFTLCREPASHAVANSTLQVTDLGTKYQVTTGPLRFTVKKQNFNLFDEAWVDESGAGAFDDAHKVVAGHDKGFSLLSSGVRYYASNDAASTATIERAGPMSVVIKVEGRLKNTSGTALYYFITRIYAYNGSREVKVVFSFENRNPDESQYVLQHGLNMELPLNLSSYQFALGAKTGAKTGTLTAGQEAYLNVPKIDGYKYGGVLDDSGSTRVDQSLDMGWALLKDGAKGVGVQTRWFWQMYPTSVEVNATGMLNVGLFSHRFTGGSTAFPPRFANHYRIYSGMSRTHVMRFAFFNDDSDEEVRAALVGVNSRLYAVAPSAWYCRVTKAFGPLVERGRSDLYNAAQWGQVNTYEAPMWNAALKCLGNTNTSTGGKDAYDFLGWGDNPHFMQAPGELMWNGNYYDLPRLILHHFARSVEYSENYCHQFLDYFYAHTTHIQDLHIVHFEPADGKDGACRYCPPMNHIGQDAVAPAVMNQTSHHKTQSLFDQYYLLGEERALDAALKGVKWIKTFGYAAETSDFTLTCYARRPGHIMNTLIAGYKHNYDAGALNNLNLFLAGIRATLAGGGIDLCGGTQDQRWMTGLMTEPLVDAYELTGNELFASTARQIIDSTPSGMNCNVSYSAGFCFRHYNAPSYLAKAYQLYTDMGNGISFSHHEKDYAENCRSVLMSFSWFAIPDSMNPRVGAERASVVAPQGLWLEVAPNPASSRALIRLNAVRDAPRIRLGVYDLKGSLVRDLSGPVAKGYEEREVEFDASRLPAGVYLFRAEAGGKTASKRAILVK